MSTQEVLAWALAQGPALVEVTGGEPLAQPAALDLLRALCEAGRTVLLETSGALTIADVDPRVHVIMDVKCPSSGMHHRLHWPNLALLEAKDEVKFVLADRDDYQYALEIIRRHGLERRTRPLLSTVWGRLAPALAVQWMLEDGLAARFQAQLHKVIWPQKDRGV